MSVNLSRRWRALLIRRYSMMGAKLIDEMVANLVQVYEQFMISGCADTQFEIQLNSFNECTHSQRLGEMLMFDRMLHAGFNLCSKDMGPDFRAEKDGEVVWLEVITPSPGADGQIMHLFDSNIPLAPLQEENLELRQRLLLRVTAAITAKRQQFEKYIKKGIIKTNESCVIVVNDALLCPDNFFYGVSHGADCGDGGRSLVEHATLGLGQAIWGEKDEAPGKFKLVQTCRNFVQTMKLDSTQGPTLQAPVPVDLFSNIANVPASGIISGVMQVTLREDYGFLIKLRNMAETTKFNAVTLLHQGSFVRNVNAFVPLPPSLQKYLMQVVKPLPMTLQS